jgi:hypothetical protein
MYSCQRRASSSASVAVFSIVPLLRLIAVTVAALALLPSTVALKPVMEIMGEYLAGTKALSAEGGLLARLLGHQAVSAAR